MVGDVGLHGPAADDRGLAGAEAHQRGQVRLAGGRQGAAEEDALAADGFEGVHAAQGAASVLGGDEVALIEEDAGQVVVADQGTQVHCELGLHDRLRGDQHHRGLDHGGGRPARDLQAGALEPGRELVLQGHEGHDDQGSV